MAEVMSQTQMSVLAHQHNDLIHHASFDVYGIRLATASADHRISIFERVDGRWHRQADFEAHNASLWRVCWAHPEFGQLVAACALDGAVVVWEEPLGQHGPDKQWTKRATLSEKMQFSALDVRFAPKQLDLGLQLVTSYEDGYVRVSEAADVMNLSNWSQVVEFTAGDCCANCVDWTSSRRLPPMIAVGCNRKDRGQVQLWKFNGSKQPKRTCDIACDKIHDISFAPSMGRSFHLLAAACDEGPRIWRVNVDDQGDEGLNVTVTEMSLDDGSDMPRAVRVSWNATGTLLAVSSADGTIRTWRAAQTGMWTPAATESPLSELTPTTSRQ